ncbi:MAG: FHA domain-containing protein, partial [Betaproteobacteria bacterium]
MAKLIVTLKGAPAGNYFIDKGRVTIGRRSDSDIHLDYPGVSKEHAVILTVGNDHIIEDLGSTNGSFVNGSRITRHILQNGDVIDLDHFQLKYVNVKASPEMDFDRTMMIRTVDRSIEALAHSARKAGGQRHVSVPTARPSRRSGFPLGGVKGIDGEFAGRKIELEQPLKTFGIEGRQLAVITRRPQGYFITHVEGKKTARVNRHAIDDEPYALQDGDVIEVGQDKLEF